jgi:putative ABC transport system ATP-binding protein
VVVDLKGLVVDYTLGRHPFTVLDIPAWTLPQGAQVAIFGPSGCGKSTLLHIIAGLMAPTRGTVVICGEDLGRLSEPELDRFRANHIGYIFQEFNLLQGYSALENVLLGLTFSTLKPDRLLARELLARVGLSQRERHLPSELSVGERQRVAIARALAHKPTLILADEPTGSLDPHHARDVVLLLQEICREHDCSLLTVSHDAEVVRSFATSLPFLELNRAFHTPPTVGGDG